jgi:hypothetical protein
MPFSAKSDTAGGFFDSPTVDGPVLASPISHREVQAIIASERFKALRAAAKQREQVLRTGLRGPAPA